jgi:hypothetical protein
MTNKNNNEKFILALLDMTDVVYADVNDEYMYFYPSKPNTLGFSVKIPTSQCSTFIDINFTFEASKRTAKDDNIVNLSFDSAHEIKDFMEQLYEKHETLLNSHSRVSPEILEKFESALKAPLNSNRYILQGQHVQNEHMILKNNGTVDFLNINIGRALFNYDEKKKFKPLAPIVIDCFYSDSTTDGNIMYKKVIPAYLVDEYPIVALHAHVHKTTKDLNELTDALNKINPKSGSALSAIILDIELDKNDNVKSSRPKL